MLCNKCQTREATVHWTACTGVVDEEPKSIDLCEECFEASNPEGAHGFPSPAEINQACCRYCGGEPCMGGWDPLAPQGGVRKMSFMCRPCAQEYFGILKRQFPGFGDPDLTTEKAAILRSKLKSCDFRVVLSELEEHMKQWVAKRKST